MSIPPRIMTKRPRHLLGITHFIRIPILNQTSSSQIQETLWKVANDPLSAAIPPKGYQPLQRLSINIAALSLPTQESRNHATSLLQDLGNQDWRKLFAKAQAALPKMRTSLAANPEILSNDVNHCDSRPLVGKALFGVMYSCSRLLVEYMLHE